MSFLDCSSCIAFRSLIVKFQIFQWSCFFNFFFDFIASWFNKCFYTMMIVRGYPVFICWFFDSIFFRRKIFISLIFETSSQFYLSKKSSNCFFIVSLLIVFCVGTKFKFLFKSLKVSLQNLLVLRLITCSARSNLNLIVSSSVFCNLIKLSWFVQWSLWRWSVRCFLLGSRETERSGTRFLNLYVCWMFLFLLLLLGDCSLFVSIV